MPQIILFSFENRKSYLEIIEILKVDILMKNVENEQKIINIHEKIIS
jgi:hypothetical protein